jgi:hypothetical protein
MLNVRTLCKFARKDKEFVEWNNRVKSCMNNASEVIFDNGEYVSLRLFCEGTVSCILNRYRIGNNIDWEPLHDELHKQLTNNLCKSLGVK